ncbi:MAG: fmt [Parcubacteria group bacterium]|nr:fmt [Parcubacteria group bacterium]
MNNSLNIAFFGTPDLTLPILNELEQAHIIPKVIVTGPDRPKGRKMVLTSPAPKLWAEERNIPVLQPEKIDEDFLKVFKEMNIDLGVVVAYGKILPQALLDIPRLGMVNVHYSLLPKYRGASPVESAILAGETATGVSIQRMVFKLDAGDVILEDTLEIQENEGTSSLRSRLNEMAKGMLVTAIHSIADGSAQYNVQGESLATRSGKIKKEDADISNDTPEMALRKIRAYDVWPRARKGDLIITSAHIENNELVIDMVIPPGKSEMKYADYLRGNK